MGDFNSNLGCRLLGEEKMIVPYGFGSRNVRGGGEIIEFL